MPKLLTHETSKTTSALDDLRHDVAKSRGLDIVAEPVDLTDDQQQAVLESFSWPGDERIQAAHDSDQMGIDRIALNNEETERYNTHAFSRLRITPPGEPVGLLKPADARGKNPRLVAYAAIGAKARAIEAAAKDMGTPLDNLQPYLDEASANVYASPHNGSPIITERVIDLPGGTIYEMNVHGAGSPEVVDAQVVAVRK